MLHGGFMVPVIHNNLVQNMTKSAFTASLPRAPPRILTNAAALQVISSDSHQMAPPGGEAMSTSGLSPQVVSDSPRERKKEDAADSLLALFHSSNQAQSSAPADRSTPTKGANKRPRTATPTKSTISMTKSPPRVNQDPLPATGSSPAPATEDMKSNRDPGKSRKRKRKEKEEAAVLAEGEPEVHALPPSGQPWVNLEVTLRNGKYKGYRATVLGLAKKKYRVQVVGLTYQLEFYPVYVGLPTPPPDYVYQAAQPAPSAASAVPQLAPSASAGESGTASGPSAIGGGDAVAPPPHTSDAGPAIPTQMVRTTSGLSASSAGSAHASLARTSSNLDPEAAAAAAAFRAKHQSLVGQVLGIRRGKYQGKEATILGLTNAKLQVQVDGVGHQLEYYPTMFHTPPPPELSALAAAMVGEAEEASKVPKVEAQAPSSHTQINEQIKNTREEVLRLQQEGSMNQRIEKSSAAAQSLMQAAIV